MELIRKVLRRPPKKKSGHQALALYFGNSDACNLCDPALTVRELLVAHSPAPNLALQLTLVVHCKDGQQFRVRLLSFQRAGARASRYEVCRVIIESCWVARPVQKPTRVWVPSADEEEAERTGRLLKYSRKRACYEECQLKLFRDRLEYQSRAKVGVIFLEGVQFKVRSRAEHVFQLQTNRKKLLFQASSKLDLEGWQTSINQRTVFRYDDLRCQNLNRALRNAQARQFDLLLQKKVKLASRVDKLVDDEEGRKFLTRGDKAAEQLLEQYLLFKKGQGALSQCLQLEPDADPELVGGKALGLLSVRQMEGCERLLDEDGWLLGQYRARPARVQIGRLF